MNDRLFTVYPDGTDLFPFAGLHEAARARSAPCETPDGWVVYVEGDARTSSRCGSLVAVRRTRSLRSRRLIADATRGLFRNPSPFADGRLVVSFLPGDSATLRGDGRPVPTFALHLLDAKTGRNLGVLFDDPDWHDVSARVVRPRPKPSGRSSVVNDTKATGELYCLDTYLTGLTISDRGDRVHDVRIVNANGMTPSLGEHMGTARVETDGSFYIELPARTPFRLETLDGEGNVIERMRSWMWVMPGERRGCIGCHEDRELTPPNRHVQALRRAPERLGQPTAAPSDRSSAKPRE